METLLPAWREFVDLERRAGGPDAHLQLAATASSLTGAEPTVRAWRIGCYIAPYIPTVGAVIWTRWPTHEAVLVDPQGFRDWVHRHRVGLRVRKERRAVWNPKNLADCLLSYAEWLNATPDLSSWDYEKLWDISQRRVRYIGRYMGMKLLEGLRRVGVVQAGMPDVRPHGAKFLRRGLGLLFPDENIGSASETRINQLAAHAGALSGQVLSWYELEVLLCNFRQALKGRFPGRTHDSDRGHHLRALDYWGGRQLTAALPFWELRARLFPPTCLGEVQGWVGDRPELGTCWQRHGYFWGDTRYDYLATDDLAHPVRRDG